MIKHLAVVIALASITGCKARTYYSANCSRSVALASPWDTMKLPIGDDARVCSSNDLKTDLEYLTGDRAGWEKAYDDAMVGQGYAKDRCSSVSCGYSRAGEKLSVQINQVAAGKKAKTIVHLTRTPAIGGGSGSATR